MTEPELSGRVETAQGRRGRLFLESTCAASMRDLYARPWPDDGRLARQWGASLARLTALAEEIGARLVVLVPPDTHGVHDADLPEGWDFQRPSVAERFAMTFGARCEVVLPHARLREARGPLDPCRPTDSHWSAFGAYIGYRALMERLAAKGQRVVEPEDFAYVWAEEAGDLGGACEPPRRAHTPRVVMHEPRARVVFEACNHVRHMIKAWEIDDAALPSCVMLRDSFATEMAPFLAESFRRTVLVGSTVRGFPDLIREERPDVILVERAERGLPQGVIDWDLTTWREHWPAPGDGPQEAEAGRAERDAARALDAGDDAMAERRAREALRLGPTPDRRLLLARALLARGEPGAAAEVLEPVVAEHPERVGVLLHLGVARLRQGRTLDARDLFARACAIAPWHPYGFEHFGYACLALDEPLAARAALEAAVRLGPELPGAWMLLLQALERLGDTVAVEATRARLRTAPVDIPDLAA